ncbi:hypothetical protein MSG28_000252 [Choristoneura fumiferana]|uniref:Uncharacterized protein n=1 Tax=Choristoneura fumiferana TaxID=7141 RepID=A0ACC0K0E7_CHOFU|nr:hypothetical protein MSG28_000252 [Choristoneura fumiferana]
MSSYAKHHVHVELQQQQQPGPASAHEALVAAVFNCSVFGDERDQVLAKWNLLQAQWGIGMDVRLWKQAQADNPDPDNYIPVPIIGFSEVNFKINIQSITVPCF